MLRISFGLTWVLTLVARLHGMADFDSRHIASTPPVCVRLWRSRCVHGKLTWTLTHPPTPNPGVTWHVRVRQVDMNVNTPTHPKRWRDVDVAFACFTKRARLLARFTPLWLIYFISRMYRIYLFYLLYLDYLIYLICLIYLIYIFLICFIDLNYWIYLIYPAGCGIARVGASPLSNNDNPFSVSWPSQSIFFFKVIFLAFGNPSTQNPDLFLPCQFQWSLCM